MFDDSHLSVNVQTGLVGLTTLLLTKWLLSPKAGKGRLPPGPKPYPVVGNALSFLKNNSAHLTLDRWAKEFGDVYTIRMGRYDVVIVSSKEAMRELFVQKGDYTIHRPIMQAHKMLDVTKGIINNMGSSWKAQRKIAIASLRDFGVGKSTQEESIMTEVDTIIQEIERAGNDAVDVQELLISAITNVICTITYGERYNYSDQEFRYLIDEMKFLFSQGGLRNISFFLPETMLLLPLMAPVAYSVFRRIWKLKDFILKKIENHRSTFDPDNIRDFIDLYLQAEQSEDSLGNQSETQMFHTILDMITAGAETTAISLRWAMIYLIRNPEVQAKCRQEIHKVVGQSRRVTYSDHSQLPYTEATIEEILRVASPVPMTLIHVVSEDFEFRDYLLPAGTMIIGNTHTIHQDPANFSEPEVLQPERWLDEQGRFQKSNAFMPFSVGPRECPGKALAYQEIFLTLTSLLQQFRFSAPDPENPPGTDGRLGITRYPEFFLVKAERV